MGMRKWIVIGCIVASLIALLGFRLFGFIGTGSGATGVQGDMVRFSAMPLAVRLLKGAPNSTKPFSDTPFVCWRYKNQVAFGRSCSIEYVLDGESPWLKWLLFGGVNEVDVEIPIEGAQDGGELFDRIYAGMQRTYSRGRGYTAEEGAPRDGALRTARVGVNFNGESQSASIELREDCVRIGAVSMW